MPAVFLDTGKPTETSSVIRVDSRGGMKAAVEHLLLLGLRELLFVRNSQKASGQSLLSHKLRDKGFSAAVRACKVHGLKTTVIKVHGPGADAGEQAIESVFGKVRFCGGYRGHRHGGYGCLPRTAIEGGAYAGGRFPCRLP